MSYSSSDWPGVDAHGYESEVDPHDVYALYSRNRSGCVEFFNHLSQLGAFELALQILEAELSGPADIVEHPEKYELLSAVEIGRAHV